MLKTVDALTFFGDNCPGGIPSDAEPPDMEQLKTSDVQGSAKAIKDILTGKDTGPKKDIVVLNAAAAIITGGLADDFPTAISMADASASTGKALKCLEKLIIISGAAG